MWLQEWHRSVNQVFALMNLYQKYLENKKDLYVAFSGLEKAYDRVYEDALLKVLQLYDVGEKLLEARSFYRESGFCESRKKGGIMIPDKDQSASKVCGVTKAV